MNAGKRSEESKPMGQGEENPQNPADPAEASASHSNRASRPGGGKQIAPTVEAAAAEPTHFPFDGGSQTEWLGSCAQRRRPNGLRGLPPKEHSPDWRGRLYRLSCGHSAYQPVSRRQGIETTFLTCLVAALTPEPLMGSRVANTSRG